MSHHLASPNGVWHDVRFYVLDDGKPTWRGRVRGWPDDGEIIVIRRKAYRVIVRNDSEIWLRCEGPAYLGTLQEISRGESDDSACDD